MEKGKFQLVLKELQDDAGEQFNKTDFFKLFAAFLEDSSYSTKVVKRVKDGKIEAVESLPVKEFQDFLVKFLKKAASMDEVDARNHVENFVFTKTDAEALINVSTEIIEQWLRTGKVFKFPSKEDMKLTLKTKKMDKKILEGSITSKDGTKKPYKTEHDGYLKIMAKSPCPSNKKKKMKV